MRSYELQPAYGRDYRSAAAARKAWNDGLDWLGDYQLGFRIVSRRDMIPGEYIVQLRYDKLRKVTVHKTMTESCSCGNGCARMPWLCTCGNGTLGALECEIQNSVLCVANAYSTLTQCSSVSIAAWRGPVADSCGARIMP